MFYALVYLFDDLNYFILQYCSKKCKIAEEKIFSFIKQTSSGYYDSTGENHNKKDLTVTDR